MTESRCGAQRRRPNANSFARGAAVDAVLGSSWRRWAPRRAEPLALLLPFSDQLSAEVVFGRERVVCATAELQIVHFCRSTPSVGVPMLKLHSCAFPATLPARAHICAATGVAL